MVKAFFDNAINLLEPTFLQENPGLGRLPYFIVGNKAFPLQPWLVKPFPGQGIAEYQRNFNCRLSRARRVIENGFGILPTSWGMMSRVI